MTRRSLDTEGRRGVSSGDFMIACSLIHKSGVLEVLAPLVDSDVGRPRYLSLEGFLVALQLNASYPHHDAHLVEVARLLNSMTDEQRSSIGIPSWSEEQAYDRVERLFVKLTSILSAGIDGHDCSWFMNSLVRASIPREVLTSRSIAVDGTDVETWGALHGASRTVVLDGEAVETQLVEEDSSEKALRSSKKVKTAKVFAIGADGRNQYTKDPDARAGHRSATGNRKAGPYVGYELHLSVQARDVRWTNYVDKVSLGDEVPNVITSCSLVPAGSHRGKSIVGEIISSSKEFQPVDDVVWDPGYSLCQPETTAYPLAREGISQTFQLVTHQRGIRPFAGKALLLDGQLFSPHLPNELRNLEMPPRFRPGHYKASWEDRFNRRARWRMTRRSGPDADGTTRWNCPFCSKMLRSRNFPKTMRLPRNRPLVFLPEGVEHCCEGTFSAPAAELPLYQKIPIGTTAWRISMNRRQVVESANAGVQGGFFDVAHGFVRVFGIVKVSFFLSFSLAAYNLDRIRSFRAAKAERGAAPRRARKRRRGTWAELLPEFTLELALAGTGPPG